MILQLFRASKSHAFQNPGNVPDGLGPYTCGLPKLRSRLERRPDSYAIPVFWGAVVLGVPGNLARPASTVTHANRGLSIAQFDGAVATAASARVGGGVRAQQALLVTFRRKIGISEPPGGSQGFSAMHYWCFFGRSLRLERGPSPTRCPCLRRVMPHFAGTPKQNQ